MVNSRRYDFAAAGLIIGFTIVRIFFAARLGLANDEAYYWVWAKHLDWSYFDHPPMVAWMIAAGIRLFGETTLGVRMPMILVSAVAGAAVYLAARKLFSAGIAWVALMLLSTNLLSLLGGFLITPDTPMILFWSLGILAMAIQVRSGRAGWWLLVGFMTGLGLLGKYTMILFVPAMVFTCLFSPKQRKWLIHPAPIAGILLAALIFLPVIYWNSRHEWVSFAHQFHHGFSQKSGFTLKYLGEYLGGQILLVNPALFFCLVIAGIQGFRRRDQAGVTLTLWLTVVPLLFFALSSLRARVEANWPAMAYFSGSVLLAWWFRQDESPAHESESAPDALSESRSQGRKRRLEYLLWSGIGFNVILAALVFVHLEHRLADLKKDRTNELFGWSELGQSVANQVESMKSSVDPTRLFLVASSYQLASQISFNMPGKSRVYEDPSRGRASVFTTIDHFDDKIGWSSLFITSADDNPIPVLRGSYDRYELIRTVEIHREGSPIGAFSIYRADGFRGKWMTD